MNLVTNGFLSGKEWYVILCVTVSCQKLHEIHSTILKWKLLTFRCFVFHVNTAICICVVYVDVFICGNYLVLGMVGIYMTKGYDDRTHINMSLIVMSMKLHQNVIYV